MANSRMDKVLCLEARNRINIVFVDESSNHAFNSNGLQGTLAVTYAKSIAIPFPCHKASAMFREKKLCQRKE